MDIKKVCPLHGPLTLEQLYKRKTTLNKNKNGFRYECHQCRIISGSKSNVRTGKKYKKLSVDELRPYYICDRLVQGGFKREDITPELIAAKAAMILLHRAIRERTKNGKRKA